MSGEQAEERTAMTKHTDSSRSTDSGVSGNAQTRAGEIRKCPDCAGRGYDCVRRPMGGYGHQNVECWTCKGTGLQPTCNRLVLTVGNQPPNHEYEVRCQLPANHGGKCEPSFDGAEPAATSVTASENTHKDSACTECSRLASRVERLEKCLRTLKQAAQHSNWVLTAETEEEQLAKIAVADAAEKAHLLLAGAHAEEK